MAARAGEIQTSRKAEDTNIIKDLLVAVQGVSSELVSRARALNSLFTREFTGKIVNFGQYRRNQGLNYRSFLPFLMRIPYSTDQGINSQYQGNSREFILARNQTITVAYVVYKSRRILRWMRYSGVTGMYVYSWMPILASHISRPKYTTGPSSAMASRELPRFDGHLLIYRGECPNPENEGGRRKPGCAGIDPTHTSLSRSFNNKPWMTQRTTTSIIGGNETSAPRGC